MKTPALICPECGYLNVDKSEYFCTHCGFHGDKQSFVKHAYDPEFIRAPYKQVERAPTLDQLDQDQDD